MDNSKALLEELGLSTQESAVYLAMLSIGFSSISDISKKAGIKRPTTYYIIEELIKKQLVSKAPKGKRIFYLAESPRKLLNNLRDQESKLEKALPELESIQKSAPNKPKIRFYEGKEGLVSAYKEIFTTHRKIIGIVSAKHVYQLFPENENSKFFEILKKEGGQIYDILDNSPEARDYIKKDYRKGMGPVKFLPENFKIGTDTMVEGNRVLQVSFSSLVAVLIENEEIAATQRQLLESLWKQLK